MVSPTPTPERGFTLLELLTVLTIISALLALGIGVYRKAASAHILPAAASQVSSVVRAARNFSLSSGLPSRVFVDSVENCITAFGFELVAHWHFEDVPVVEDEKTGSLLPVPPETELFGALREFGAVFGEVYPARGKVGMALEFSNDGAAMVAYNRPRLYSPYGFSLEAWVRFWPPPLPTDSVRSAMYCISAFTGSPISSSSALIRGCSAS